MAGVNVSREGLTGVRTSLNQFKTEIGDVPFSMARQADMVQSECENVIRGVEAQISQLKGQISNKNEELRQLQENLINARNQSEDTEKAMYKTELCLAGIGNERNKCEKELSHLRARLSCGDENEQSQCRQAIGAAEAQLAVLTDHECQAAAELRAQKERIRELRSEIGRSEGAIRAAESELMFLKEKLFRKEDKQKRLNMAYNNLISELNILSDSVRRFSQFALTQTQQDIAGVDQCIRYIDGYLATNL